MPAKLYPDDFTTSRRLAYTRFVSQARYRGEVVNLTFEEFCRFWHTEKLWNLRGRSPSSLVLTRFDPNLPWDTKNCCILRRGEQLEIRNKRRTNSPVEHYYKDAIHYE